MAGWTPPAGDADWQPPASDNDATRAVSQSADIADDDSPEAAEAKALAGGSEAVANTVTGLAGQAVGGLGYLGKSLTNAAGITSGDPLDVARGISDTMTYQPRTDQGQRVAQIGGDVMNAPERPIERAEDYLDPSGNLKATANDVAERGNYALSAAQAVTPMLHAPEVPEAPRAPERAAPAAEVSTPEERIAAIKAAPDPLETPSPAPQQKVAGKPHYTPKAGEPVPAAPAAAENAAPAAASPPVRFVAPAREGQVVGAADDATQADRTNVLHDLNDLSGGDLGEVRTSAITGDYSEAGTDFQHARMDDAAGKRMQSVIANESRAVQDAAVNATEKTGSQVTGTDEVANQQRGQVIDRALQGIKTWFDNPDPQKPGIIQQVYRQAMNNAGNQPVPHFTQTANLLGDQSQFMGTAEGEALYRGAMARAQTLGLIGDNGVWKPATVEQAERFRQWVNDQYTPRTGKMIGQLKSAIDEDVANHGGPGLLKQARFLRRRYAQMLQEPQGIADALEKDGLNRKVAVKELPEHIASLEPEQFKHVMDVLKSAIKNNMGNPADIDAALTEIKGHMANRMLEAGRKDQNGIWNPQQFYKEANRYSLNMPQIFTPEEMKAWGTVNRGGNVLRMDKSYPGAAAQFQKTGIAPRLVKGVTKVAALGATGAALGSEGGMAGLAVHTVGKGLEHGIEKFTAGRTAKARMNEVEGRITQLGERPAPEPTGGGSQKPRPNSPATVASGTVTPAQPLGATIRGGAERGAVGADLRGQRGFLRRDYEDNGVTTNNDSGGGPASVEAQRRYEQEKANGQERYQIDPDGNVTPLTGVDSVDARAPQGHLIVQRGVGDSNYSILDRGGLPQGQAHGLLARAVGLGKLDNRPLGARIGGKQRGAVGDLGNWRQKSGLSISRPTDSIERSAESAFGEGNYTVRPGTHILPFSDVELQGEEPYLGMPPMARTPKFKAEVADLTKQIQKNQRITPLMVGKRADGSMYVMEGQHRARALQALGHDSFPAQIADERPPGTRQQELPLGARIGGGKQRGAVGILAQDNGGGLIGALKRRLSGKDETPLEGAPEGDRPNGKIRAAAAAYKRDNGITTPNLTDYRYVAPEDAKAAADAYTAMKHDPTNPKVKATYDAFIAENNEQFKQALKAGIKFQLDDNYGSKYPQPRDVMDDVRDNKHMSIFPTESGFGTEGAAKSDHPMMQPSPFKIGGRQWTNNDVFRAVHDIYGHVAEGNGFRANGEYNAWRSHRTMYSPAAQPAMDAETLGQNSWVNAGPHAEHNRTASAADTIYAEQKAGIMKLPKALQRSLEEGVSADEHHVTGLLTEPERAQLRVDTTERMIDRFKNLPGTPEYAAAALAGKAKRGWYRASAEAILNHFGLEDGGRFTALLAAMSPQTSVQMNFSNALKTFLKWDEAGRPQDPASIRRIMEENSAKNPKSKSDSNVLDAWVNNAVRALTAEDPLGVKLSGPKVHSFYNNLLGHVNEVTNDAWMSTFAKIDPTAKGTSLSGGLNGAGPGKTPMYMAMSARVREAAKMLTKMTGETWSPAEVQETVWSWAKTAFEHAEELGDQTIPELVKHGKITDDLIRSTPDFHQLFATPEHAGLIGRSRFARNVEGVSGTQGAGAQPVANAEKTAAAERALRPHLEKAAERLEQVRQERGGEAMEEAPF